MSPPERQPIEIVAHRGAGRDDPPAAEPLARRTAAPPENTLPAFAWGWEEAPACELDLRLSRDDELVVIHDKTTGRTCDRNLVVAESTLGELRRLDAGAAKGAPWTGARIPTLAEVIAQMPPQRRLYVELKIGPAILAPLLDLHTRSPLPPSAIVFLSFNLDTIARLKEALPEFGCFLVAGFACEEGRWQAGYRRSDAADGGRFDGRRVRLPSSRDEGPQGLAERLARSVLEPAAEVAVAPGTRLDGLDVSHSLPDGFAPAMSAAGVAWGAWNVDTAEAAFDLAAKGAIQLTSNCPGDLVRALRVGGPGPP